MLRAEVVAAAAAGRFHVYAVGHVDEALELLMGQEAGRRDASGAFAPGSVNALVEARLRAFAESARDTDDGHAHDSQPE
jgi:predicted ATP-dependent protease